MYYFIVNPVAGGGQCRKKFQRICQILTEKNVPYEFEYTQGEGHATELAKKAVQDGRKYVICAGGDGTVMETAQGLIGSESCLGVLPMGTGNDFSRSLGMEKDAQQALDQLLSAEESKVDMGKMGERLFLNSAGIGFDVDVVVKAQAANKHVHGMAAYLCGVVGALIKLKSRRLRIVTEDRVIEQDVLLTVVANGRYFGGGMQVCPDASPSDGLFDVLVVDKVGRFKILRLLSKFISGKHTSLPIIQYFKCKEVTITGESDYMQHDGCVFPYASGKYEILRSALNVMLPRA